MQRTTKSKKYDFILAADIHTTKEQPIARTDSYWESIQRKIIIIKKIQDKMKIPVLVAGDIFNKWNASPEVERWCFQNMFSFVAVPGQHDLPHHNLTLFPECSLAVLQSGDPERFIVLTDEPYQYEDFTIYPFPWGSVPKNDKYPRSISTKEIAICHYTVNADWPGAESEDDHSLLKRLDYDLILTGDNHKPFIVKDKDKMLVNPGSFMRRAADQIDHRPRVYLYSFEDNEATPFYLPIEKDAITREHVEKEAEKEERIAIYITRLKDDYEVTLSFEKNLEVHFKKNKIHQRVQEMAWEDIEE